MTIVRYVISNVADFHLVVYLTDNLQMEAPNNYISILLPMSYLALVDN